MSLCSLFIWRGSVNLPSRKEDEPERAIKYIIASLRLYSARDIRRVKDVLQFNGGVFRGVSNLNPLNSIGRGKLAVHRNPSDVMVQYELDYTQLALVSFCVGLIFSGVIGKFEGILAAVIAGAIVCTFFFFLGFATSFRNIPKLIRHAGLGLED